MVSVLTSCVKWLRLLSINIALAVGPFVGIAYLAYYRNFMYGGKTDMRPFMAVTGYGPKHVLHIVTSRPMTASKLLHFYQLLVCESRVHNKARYLHGDQFPACHQISSSRVSGRY